MLFVLLGCAMTNQPVWYCMRLATQCYAKVYFIYKYI